MKDESRPPTASPAVPHRNGFAFILHPSSFILVCSLLCGCDGRPRAPALQSGPLYQNEREGFRFLAPDGWVQRARAELPPGHYEKPELLVAYTRVTDRPAEFEVSLADLPEGADLQKFLTGMPTEGVRWQAKGPPEALTVNGVPATRFPLAGGAGKAAQEREVVAFRRGGRVYFFAGTFPAGDRATRDDVRRAVNSIVWKG
jgi:hypothetical protein